MTQEIKVMLGIGIATLVIIIGATVLLSGNGSSPSSQTIKADPKLLIRADSNKLGNPSSKVTLVEFGDYQCPACGAAYPILKQITDTYKDKIFFVFRNFPLPMHQNAPTAAEAAEAAGIQGKYWEMHDLLYKNQTKWADSNDPLNGYFVGYATNLGLNVNKFKQDVQNQQYAAKIQEDENDGNTLGVNETPTLYLNGVQMAGVPNYDDLKGKIDSLLK